MRSNLASILSAASLASSGLAWPRPRPSSGTRSSAASAGRCSGAPRRCTTCQRQYSAHDSYPKRRRPSATAMAATGERSQGPWPQQHWLPLATASLLLRARTAAANDGRAGRHAATSPVATRHRRRSRGWQWQREEGAEGDLCAAAGACERQLWGGSTMAEPRRRLLSSRLFQQF